MLTTTEVAQKLALQGLKYTPDEVANLAKLRVFPGAIKDNGIWQIPLEDVNKFIKQTKRRWLLITTSSIFTLIAIILASISSTKDGIDLINTYVLSSDQNPQVSIQLPEQPIIPLIGERLASDCNPRLFFYDAKEFEPIEVVTYINANKYYLPEMPNELPWLPGILTFSLQGQADGVNDIINISDVIIEQERQPLSKTIVAFENFSPCAEGERQVIVPETTYTLGSIEINGQNKNYSLLRFERSLNQVTLDNSSIKNYGIFLVGIEPGEYKLRIHVKYQYQNSGILTTTSDWITAIVLEPKSIDKWYELTWLSDIKGDSYISDRPYPNPNDFVLGVTELDDNEWKLGDITSLSIENIVRNQWGEYIVIKNSSNKNLTLEWPWKITDCKDTYSISFGYNDLEVDIDSNNIVRLWTGDLAHMPTDALAIPEAPPIFGSCVLLKYEDATISIFPKN